MATTIFPPLRWVPRFPCIMKITRKPTEGPKGENAKKPPQAAF